MTHQFLAYSVITAIAVAALFGFVWGARDTNSLVGMLCAIAAALIVSLGIALLLAFALAARYAFGVPA